MILSARAVAEEIEKKVFPSLRRGMQTIFLVGAGRTVHRSLRNAIRDELTPKSYYKWLDIYYPEDLFEELIRGSSKFDLLSLENLLARSVHVVVMVLESIGAIAELGAFSNHPDLQNRLIVLVDKKYQQSKSFISLGPIRFLNKRTESIIIYESFSNPDIKKVGEKILKSVKKISKNVSIDNSINNPIQNQYFLLAAIYALEPVGKHFLNKLVLSMQSQAQEDVNTIVSVSLKLLLKDQQIILDNDKYRIARRGKERLQTAIKFSMNGQIMEKSLDKIRANVLNVYLRKGYLK